MRTEKINGLTVEVFSYTAAVVGSGCAGLNCCDLLASAGVDVCLVTEGMQMGTSRNTGSDKQTYYKLTLTGREGDSVYSMAETLYSGGAMQGDIALCEAAGSAGAFFRLCGLGVPFPSNEYGEYVGYKTDHDPRSRATSCGPLTSRYMTEALEASVKFKNVPIYDGWRVVEIAVSDGKVCGFFAVNHNSTKYNYLGIAYFKCENLIWATGGPSAIYDCTVYPQSQTCSHGTLFRTGAKGVNLTESQYGIASCGDFRWNLSGSYQQVIPRYFSTAADGISDERELDINCDLIFLKGYQWPFDPRKLPGSSEVDMAVYREKQAGRRVFLDFRCNPLSYSFKNLGEEARNYLISSDAVAETPIKRLRQMNERAYRLYLDHGIDLETDPLEIAVCAQHNNGGFKIDINYESSIERLFVIGEAAGVFGVYRPGGSALNSTQVSSARAASFIANNPVCCENKKDIPDFSLLWLVEKSTAGIEDIIAERHRYGKVMDSAGAFIRRSEDVSSALDAVKAELDAYRLKGENSAVFLQSAINYDILTTQYVYLSAIYEYIRVGGKSRGSYLINSDPSPDTENSTRVCVTSFDSQTGNVCHLWEETSPIPQSEQWFEKVYNRK